MEIDLKLTPQQKTVFSTVKPDVDAGAAALRDGRAAEAVELFTRAAKGLPADFPSLPQVWHNVLVACRQAIEKVVKKGSETAGDEWVRKALETPDLPAHAAADLRRFRAETFKGIGLFYFEHHRFNLSAALHRKAIATQTGNGYLINLSNALVFTRQPGMLSDYTASVKPEQLAPKLLVACVPKSGSSFLYTALAQLTGWRDIRAFAPAGQFEQELFAPALVENARTPSVIQQHCRATEVNLQIMQAFRMRPVVLVRNFADALLSLVEFYRNGAFRSTVFQEDFPKLTYEQQVDLLIEFKMPWYFEFVASWQMAERDKRLPIYWLTYEQMIADKPGTLRRLVKYWNLKNIPEDRFEKVIAATEGDKKKSRFNVGRAGRGKRALTEKQLERLASYARFFPLADFARFGLVPSDNPEISFDALTIG